MSSAVQVQNQYQKYKQVKQKLEAICVKKG